MKDKDLDILLSEYRNKIPSDFQIQKWKTAVRSELSRDTQQAIPNEIKRSRVWIQVIAASLVGFLVGAMVFSPKGHEGTTTRFPQNESGDATIEYVYTKSD
jgi:hypothetical protein